MNQAESAKRNCPRRCSPDKPEIRKTTSKEIPPDVRLQIGDETVFKCVKCGTYWIESPGQSLKMRRKIVGYHETAPEAAGDYWLTADGQFRKKA